MDWYYANGGERFGPVDDAEFRRLVAEGVVAGDSLVWNPELPNWKPWAELVSGASRADVALGRVPTAQTAEDDRVRICPECTREFTERDGVPIRGLWVCAACKPITLLRHKQGGPMVGEIEYATFAPRFFAKLIDMAVLGVIASMPNGLLMAVFGAEAPSPDDLSALFLSTGFIGGMLALPLNLALNTFFVGRYGATPGKLVLKLRVVDVNLEPVTYLRALGRCLAEIISGVTCYIGYLMAVYDGQCRTLHDHIAGTRVIVDRGEPQP